MDNSDPDCKLLRDSVAPGDKTFTATSPFFTFTKHKKIKIYRVKSNEPSAEGESPRFLLLHGTTGPNVEGILKEGFRPSKNGRLGPGVYLTDSFETALGYGSCYVSDEGVPKAMHYVFLNKVERTDAKRLKDGDACGARSENNEYSFARPKPYVPRYVNGKKRKMEVRSQTPRYFCKENTKYERVLKVYSEEQHAFLDSTPQDLFYSDLKQTVKGTFDVMKQKIAVAHHELVAPAYLIEFEAKYDASEIVAHLLYKKFNVFNFKDVSSCLFKNETINRTTDQTRPAETDVRSLKEFNIELRKEMIANQQAKIKLLKSKFDYYVTSLMKQLPFEMSAVSRTGTAGSIKYKTEALQTSHKDYRFISSSLDYSECEENTKILHLFRIDPVDENEAEAINASSLYLQGVTANKVMNILTSGYPKYLEALDEQCKKGCFAENVLRSNNCFCYGSTSLSTEILKGTSYCSVENKVKKLSFVFVTSKKHSIPLISSEDSLHDGKSILDSRGCSLITAESSSCSKSDAFRSRFPKFSSTCVLNMIPAYLIVFEV